MYGSRSRRCVLIDVILGRWGCRSCGQRGDAAALGVLSAIDKAALALYCDAWAQ